MTRLTLSSSQRQKLLAETRNRCGYCLTPAVLSGIPLTIDHILPLAAGGSDELENLWLACRSCNEFKHDHTMGKDPHTGEMTPLFNPHTQKWQEHFAWTDDGTKILGQTAVGRATIVTLKMNHDLIVQARQRWVQAGWHPPQD